MEDKYVANLTTLTENELNDLQKLNFCVVGCGSVGSLVLELLSRVGVNTLVGIDSSNIETVDLSSHIISTKSNIHENKALEAKKRVFNINPDVYFIPINERLTEKNSIDLLAGNNLVIDTTNNLETKLIIQQACKKLEVPIITCFLCGWSGYITSLLPGNHSIEIIYEKIKSLNDEFAQSFFTAPLLSSILVSESIKMLVDKGELLGNDILSIDLLDLKIKKQNINKIK